MFLTTAPFSSTITTYNKLYFSFNCDKKLNFPWVSIVSRFIWPSVFRKWTPFFSNIVTCVVCSSYKAFDKIFPFIDKRLKDWHRQLPSLSYVLKTRIAAHVHYCSATFILWNYIGRHQGKVFLNPLFGYKKLHSFFFIRKSNFVYWGWIFLNILRVSTSNVLETCVVCICYFPFSRTNRRH